MTTMTKPPTIKELAKALKISTRRISTLLSEGMPRDIPGAKKWRAEKATPTDSAEELRQRRIALLLEQTRRAKILADEAEGKLIDRDTVRNDARAVYTFCKHRLVKFSNDLPSRLVGLESEAKMQAVIRAEVYEVLVYLSTPSNYPNLPIEDLDTDLEKAT